MKQLVIDRLGISQLRRTGAQNSSDIEALLRAAEVHGAATSELGSAAARTDGRIAALEHAAAQQGHDLESLAQWKSVTSNTALFSVLATDSTSISVVMATRDRASMCERALRSVLAQRHQHWQLVIVDDGSTDATPEMLGRLDDERVVVLRADGIGAAAARNLGLASADGQWVAFLDDDNVMDPGWLHAVAMSALRLPSAVAFYGAQLRQHEASEGQPIATSMLFATPADLDALRHDNRIDLGALAVRRDSPELSFHADLQRFIDWDLVVRLHAAHGLQPLFAWSGVYTTEAGVRISERGGVEAIDAFRARLADGADSVGKPAGS